MEIRKAQISDLALLLDFAERSFRVAYAAKNEPKVFNDYCEAAFTQAKFLQEMEDPASAFWMGWRSEQLVAYLKLNYDTHTESLPHGKTIQVERIYIEPSLQGQGLGLQLLDFTMEQAQKAGAAWIWLSVWKENPNAVRFYERCGYDICGTEIFQLGDDPQVDWVMRKAVNSL